MNVLIIGATGYIGTAVDEALTARGHKTVGVARSDTAKAKLQARGTNVVYADAAKPNTLAGPLKEADAVVYAVNVTDADPWAVDTGALKAIRKGLAGTEKTFVYVSGAWIYGSTGDRPATEDAPLNPPTLMVRRVEFERATIEMTKLGVRALVVRPGIVYGRGAGLPSMFVQSARERGAATIVGEGHNHWSTIDVGDLGELIALAVEYGRPGRAYNAANDDQFVVEEIAKAASRGAGKDGATTTVPYDIMGQMGECLALDQILSSDRAKNDLGWRPKNTSIVEELEKGSYVGAVFAH
jgi:nucleoside-diphosphate-sugar epimerase